MSSIFGSRASKEKSHHSSGKSSHHHSHKSKSERRHRESTQYEPNTGPAPLTFLFVMVEHFISEETQYRVNDRWGNVLPPENLAAYDHAREIPGRVWRYFNGEIQGADGYQWMRNPDGVGGIYPVSHGHITGGPMVGYKTTSVFNCGRFLPCIHAPADSSITRIDGSEDLRWEQLAFESQEGLTDTQHGVVSRIWNGQRHLSVRRPTWMPDLVPSCHGSVTGEDSPVSRGLGGCIGVILGLMALSQRPGRADNVFNAWRSGRWPATGVRRETADPHPAGPPRGILVHVCPDGWTEFEDMLLFEATGIMVYD